LACVGHFTTNNTTKNTIEIPVINNIFGSVYILFCIYPSTLLGKSFLLGVSLGQTEIFNDNL
jgi:hypothetical protein